MPTSFSKPLITAPLSLVQTEAHQPPISTSHAVLYFRTRPQASGQTMSLAQGGTSAGGPSHPAHPHSSRPQGNGHIWPWRLPPYRLVAPTLPPSGSVPLYAFVWARLPIPGLPLPMALPEDAPPGAGED